MSDRNSKRSEDLRLSLMAAVIQVCQQKLHFAEFIHITGCLLFSIDNTEKLDVVFSEVIGATTASAPAELSGDVVPCPPLTKLGATETQREGRRRKCGNDTTDDEDTQENTGELSEDDGTRLQDEEKNELQELEKMDVEKMEELFQTTSVKSSVNIEPVGRAYEDQLSPTALLSNIIEDIVKECEGRDDDSKKRHACDFVTDHDGDYRSHLACHDGVIGSSQGVIGSSQTSNKSFVSVPELRRRTTQVHPRHHVKCPQCPEQFSTSVKVKKHLKVAHGVNSDMVSCQSCSQRFITLELLQDHVRSRHEKVCAICSATFTDQLKLAAHRRSEHPDSELKCMLCGHRCPTKGALRKHMFDHRDHKQYKCDQCDKCFTSGSTLYHHKRAMHADRKPYVCEICGKNFNFRNSLKLHVLQHRGQRPYKCPACDKSYLTASHLKNHVRAIHDESKPFRCTICGKSFPYENSLRLHKMLHTGDRPFTCAFCGRSFVSRSALLSHEGSQHAKNAAYTCDVCRKSYKTPSLLRAHRRRHTADGERFICDVCGQRFMYRSNLEAHCAVHSDARAHECGKCGKRFKTYPALYSHVRLHLPSKSFVCAKCEKCFKTKERLRAHESRHLGEKPFVCRLCSNAFPDKGGLTKHVRSVHASKPRYACPVCRKTCNRVDNLRVHMKIHADPELLKLSLKELAIAAEPDVRTKVAFRDNATNVLASLQSAGMREMEGGGSTTVLTASDQECLQTIRALLH